MILGTVSITFLWRRGFWWRHRSKRRQYWRDFIVLSIRQRRINPPLADKGLIPRPLGRLRWFPIDTALLAAGKFITNGSMFKRKELGEK